MAGGFQISDYCHKICDPKESLILNPEYEIKNY